MAVTDWRKILHFSDEQLEELRFSGFSFLREGHYKKALWFFNALVIMDPTNAYDTQTLGALHLQMGEGEKALAVLDQALALEPLHEPTLLNKVKAHLLLGQTDEAMTLAQILAKSEDVTIAHDVEALLFAYR